MRRGFAGGSIPVGALITNFPATGPMDHEDVVTFIHEFGHLLHGLYSGDQPWAADDMANLENDFIEAPSQFLEEYGWDYRTLVGFAVDDRGRPIPADLVARMNRARRFNEALDAKTQIYQSAVALDYYMQPAAMMNFDEVWRRNQTRYAIRPYVIGSHTWASFEHLNNYVASYYTYV